MIFNFHKNHKELVLTIFVMYALLSLFIAVVPAFEVEQNNGPVPGEKDLTPQQRRGLAVFIANGCVACHTQQVRNIEMDKVWGSRPSIPADYFYSKRRMSVLQQSPSLLGSERTGPDLTNVGERLPSDQWQYLHLFNPRALVPQSIMPAFPWLFEVKAQADSTRDVVVQVPNEFRKDSQGVVVATQEAQDLVAYLLSLKQADIPTAEDFLPMPQSLKKQPVQTAGAVAAGSASDSAAASGAPSADGQVLYQSTCAVCHQPSGEGVKGAFPPLKGSPVVDNDDPSLHIKIILEGYDARAEYSVMPPFKDRLSDDEIAAIVNFERSNWGNHSKKVTTAEVTEIRNGLK
jgi:cytochrome c oxidase cbb3-type subunit 2